MQPTSSPAPRRRTRPRNFATGLGRRASAALLLAVTLGCAFTVGCTGPAGRNSSANPTPDPARRFAESEHSLTFGDTTSTAVLLVPKPEPLAASDQPTNDRATPLPPTPTAPEQTPPSSKPLPAILWIGGFGPVDRDESFGTDPDGEPISTLAGTTCEFFAERGFVTLRYDKRHVRGRFSVDRQRFLGVGLREFLADATVALAWLRARPEVDDQRVVVFGYDEGARLAVTLSHSLDSPPCGLVLLSPIVQTMAETFRRQAALSGRPFLRRYATRDTVDPLAIGEARLDPAGVVARRIVDALLDPRALGTPRISRRFDLDGDGRLHLTSELIPAWRQLFAQPDPRLDPPEVLPLLEQWPPPVPTFVLHGANGDTVSPGDLAPLRAGGNGVELTILPGLGHTLGPAASPADDTHRPIETPVLQRVATWLENLVSSAPTTPPAR